MKTTRKFIIVLSCVLLAFFLIALICFAFSNSEKFLHNIVLAQLVVFSLAVCSVIAYLVMPQFRELRSSIHDISKIVLLSETNAPMEEIDLTGKTSALINKRDAVYISPDGELTAEGYAVINRVESDWFVERVSDARSVGLKRAGEQYVYKLKMGTCYRLNMNDILYIEDKRLLVL